MKRLLDNILEADNLPSLPAVAIQVLRLTQSEEVSVNDIAKTIEQDPALAAKILRIVNSSLFSLPKRIASLPQAMVVLGLRTVKVMALSFSVVNKLGTERYQDEFDYELFWRRSITTAVCARLLAQHFDPAVSDEAFIAGLLADLGILAAIECSPQDYLPILRACQNGESPPQDVEIDQLGMTHAAITAALLDKWGLPEDVVEATAHHHDPEAPPAGHVQHLVGRLVWAAAVVSDLFCGHISSIELNNVTEMLARELGSHRRAEDSGDVQDHIRSILERVDEHVHEIARRIAIEIGTVTTYQELHEAAVRQLAQLSMTSELDRAIASREIDAARRQIECLNSETEALEREALIDSLTEVANRKAFDQKIAELVEMHNRSGEAVGLIMLDLDCFKEVNDTYGHLFGDEVLKVIGQTLKNIENDNRHVARFGGEEFAILCAQTTLRQLLTLAESVRRELAQIELQYGTKSIKITTSLGVAQVETSSQHISCEELIQRADQCLLKAKHHGRNRTHATQIGAHGVKPAE